MEKKTNNLSKSIENLLARRAALLGPNISTFYDQPLHLVKGAGAWVWDAVGRKYGKNWRCPIE